MVFVEPTSELRAAPPLAAATIGTRRSPRPNTPRNTWTEKEKIYANPDREHVRPERLRYCPAEAGRIRDDDLARGQASASVRKNYRTCIQRRDRAARSAECERRAYVDRPRSGSTDGREIGQRRRRARLAVFAE